MKEFESKIYKTWTMKVSEVKISSNPNEIQKSCFIANTKCLRCGRGETDIIRGTQNEVASIWKISNKDDAM